MVRATLCMILAAAFIHCLILIHGARIHYPNIDEAAHLPAGISHLRLGRFDMYRVNPPLVRTMAATFVVPEAHDEFNWNLYSDDAGARPEFSIGVEAITKLGVEYRDLFFRPRIACIPVSIAGLLILSYWTYTLFGCVSSVLTAFYWALSPSLLAHAQTIGPDLATATSIVLSAFLLYCYALKPAKWRLFLCGVAVGFGLLVKLTCVLVLPIAVLVVAIASWRERRPGLAVAGWNVFVLLALALLILNAGYLFEGSFRRLGDYQFCSKFLGGPNASRYTPENRFAGTLLGEVPVPTPCNWLQGADYLRWEVESRKWSFLLGEWKLGGWPHYYVVAVLTKTPVPTLLATMIGVILLTRDQLMGRLPSESRVALAILGAISVSCFVAVSFQSGFNHHHRYVLFIYPLLFMLSSSLAEPRFRRLSLRFAGLGMLVLMCIDSFRVSPHYLGYFNHLAGGPAGGSRILAHSNVDWGQDLALVADWIKLKRKAEPESYIVAEIAYFNLDATIFGGDSQQAVHDAAVRAISSEERNLSFWVVCSKNSLNSRIPSSPFLRFRNRIPNDSIALSFHAYNVSAAEALDILQSDHL